MKFNRDSIPAIAVGIVAFVVYATTCAPDVWFTDAGELAAVAATQGVAHPTGYPLFSILASIWMKIPFPFSAVFQMNLFAAMATAVGSGLFFLAMRTFFSVGNSKISDLSKSLVAAAASLTLAFSSTVWAQATSVEVYSLQFLIFNLLIFLLVKAATSERRSAELFLVSAFFFGLSFGNHMSTIFILFAGVFIYILQLNSLNPLAGGKLKVFAVAAILFVFGLSVYFYLPLLSATNPAFDWGGVSRGFDKFWYHVTGKQYQVWMFQDVETGANFGLFMKSVSTQLGLQNLFRGGGVAFSAIVWSILTLAGIVRAAMYSYKIPVFFCLIILSCLLYSINYSIHDIENYYLAAVIGFTAFAAYGLLWLAEALPKSVYAVFVLPLAALILNYSDKDLSDDVSVREYMRNMVAPLDTNAVIFSSQWDFWVSAFWYYQSVEGYRPDVAVIDHEMLRRTWYPEQLERLYPEVCLKCEEEKRAYLEYLEIFESKDGYVPERHDPILQRTFENYINCIIFKNIDERPVYATIDVVQKERGIGRNMAKYPEGFALRFAKENPEKVGTKIDDLELDALLESVRPREDRMTRELAKVTSLQLVNMGKIAFVLKDFREAKKAFGVALQFDSTNTAAAYGLLDADKALSR